MEILEPQLRALYKLLGHNDNGGYSDVRCIIPEGSPLEQETEFQTRLLNFKTRQGREPNKEELRDLHLINRSIIQGEEAVLAWARTYNGRGNCYIGRTARTAKGELKEFRTITADIDPNRERGTSADATLSSKAIEAGKTLVRAINGGYCAASGNGVLVIYRLPKPVTTDFKAFEAKFKQFEDEMRKHLPEGVTLDATFDTARMVKLLGTVSTKGDKTNWRVSRFVDFPSVPYLRNTVLERIESMGTVPVQAIKIPSAVELGYKSRSEAVFGLASFCKSKGLSKEATLAALASDPFGRDRPDDNLRVVEKLFSEVPQASKFEPEIQELQYITAGDKLNEHRERLLNRKNFPKPEMSIGIELIDRHTWGLRRGEIFTIAARPGIGKTSIASSITVRMAREGKRVLYFTSEISADTTLERLLQVLSGLSGDKFKTGDFTDADKVRLDAAYAELKGFGERLTICDSCSPEIIQVKRLATKLSPDLVIYDHIQHIGGEYDGARANVSKFMRGLKDLSREQNCAVLALSQIRRLFRDKDGKELKPTLSDLKESGTIEEESAAVLLLSVLSDEAEGAMRCLYSDLAKNRYGPTAVVGVEFDKPTATFKDMEVRNIDEKS